MNIQKELGLPISPYRYSDDDDVIEAQLLRSLDRWGDRQVPRRDTTQDEFQTENVYAFNPRRRRLTRYQRTAIRF